MEYLTCDDVLGIHYRLVEFFRNDGDPIEPSGPRDMALLESACDRPKTGLGGSDKYETIDQKAAALFHSLVSNHPFYNGNKRTALVSTVWFLDQNSRRVKAEDDEWFDFVLSVADGRVPGSERVSGSDDLVNRITGWISQHTSTRSNQPVGMRTSEFLEAVEKAGGSYRKTKKGGTWLVRGPGGDSIRISKSTRQLAGPQIRVYVARLGLSEAFTGISFDEFQGGYAASDDLIYELLTVLRQLAHT